MTSVTTEPTVIAAGWVTASLDAIVDPDAPEWADAPESVVELQPTPLDRQPSAYVQEAWRGQARGDIAAVAVRATRSTHALALRLEWQATDPVRLIDDVNTFADACAVLFPADGRSAELATMGSPEAPVRGWYWRAGEPAPFSIRACGIGTVERDRDHDVVARGRWEDNRWAAVLGVPLGSQAYLTHHEGPAPVAFAVWSGAAGERAGLKSHTPVWHRLDLGEDRSPR